MGLFNDNFIKCPNCNSPLLEEKIQYAIDKETDSLMGNRYTTINPVKLVYCAKCNTQVLKLKMKPTIFDDECIIR